jgi:hypothetical protein
MGVSLDQMESLVGKKIPGGEYTVERWENVLLHDVVEFPPPPDGIVHPIGLFHVPLAACGWNYRQIFEVCGAESDEAVRAGEYTWELMSPMREGIAYRVDGQFTGVERKQGRRGGVFDKVTFRLEVVEQATGRQCARVTNSWLFLRSQA